MLTEEMRPKLKADTCYIQVPEGVYIRGNHGGIVLKGQSLYHLLVYLAPRLNGEKTLQALTDGLKPDQKSMVTKLVDKLLVRHFLQDMSQQHTSTLSPDVLTTYASAITFIGSFQTSPAYHFEQFRNQRLLVIGSGTTFTAMIQACLQGGIKHIDAMSYQTSIDASFSLCDPEQTVRLLDAFPWDNEATMRDTVQAYDTIMAIADQPLLARARVLNRICVEQRKTCVQALIIDEQAWVGPLLKPDTLLEQGGCWECAWLRLQAHGEQKTLPGFTDQANRQASRFLTPSAAMLLAYRLAFNVFTSYTQAGRIKQLHTITTLNLKTSFSESHSFLPHPCCTACQQPQIPTGAQFLEHIQHLQQQEPLQIGIFLEQLARCFDSKLGLFAERAETDFVQMPLAVLTLRVLGQHEQRNVLAAKLDLQAARLQVSLQACACYAARIVDGRRLLPVSLVQQQAAIMIEAGLSSVDDSWAWAFDMQLQQPYLVPAEQVFPTSGTGRGVAAGMSWAEASCRALLDWSDYLTLAQLTQTRQPYRQVDLDSVPLTVVGRQLYQLLIAAGCQITIYDVAGDLHIPMFAICSGQQVVAYGTQYTVAEALEHGLEQALQYYQAIQFDRFAYVPAAVAELPMNLRADRHYIAPETAEPETWSARLNWLLERFQANGLRVMAVPLDHDPVLSQTLPFIVRLLLTHTTRDGREEWITTP
ncbi:hypothetical protein KDW_56750 [Dictyobacter vulcani]|uniref:YcaO domain-containing protein n=1 Tax=Dictyobacter vulcani TaxID=2607529 RepID=A0A5J4KV80_9CHLR|nr:TOMM precursor leader peptide-binding protein [Dictyobacter vulcani]GER91513.1 hypothetical protein KDW_56750 [Dictyobacter vulcani]